jgi:hypothetical protein
MSNSLLLVAVCLGLPKTDISLQRRLLRQKSSVSRLGKSWSIQFIAKQQSGLEDCLRWLLPPLDNHLG